MITTSIVITCYNSDKYVKRCIDSVLKYISSSAQVIVVNDGSTDNTEKILRTYIKKRVLTVNLPKNIGASASRNIGATQAKGKYLIFLDIDCIDISGIEKLVLPLKKYAAIGMTQAVLMRTKTQVDSVGHFISYVGLPYNITRVEEAVNLNKFHEVFGTRTALAIRRDLFKKIGGYDEDYIIYGEDTDLAWRTWLSGKKVILATNCTVLHTQKSSMNRHTNYRVYYEGSKNALSNILKNAHIINILYMLPFFIGTWILISSKLIVRNQISDALWIYRGLLWNLFNLIKTLSKRRRYKNTPIPMHGNISVLDFIKRGFNWSKSI